MRIAIALGALCLGIAWAPPALAGNQADRFALGLQLGSGVVHGDLQNNLDYGGFGGDELYLGLQGRYGLTSNLGLALNLGFQHTTGEQDFAIFRSTQDPADFSRNTFGAELDALVNLAPDSRISPFIYFGGGLYSVSSLDETGTLFAGLDSGDGYGSFRAGLGTDFFLDDHWALTLQSGYTLASNDRIDGIEAGGFGDGVAGARVGLSYVFGSSVPSIYTALMEGSIDEAALLDQVDTRIAEANAKIAWETKKELDELRTALAGASRERGGLSHQQVVYFETSRAELDESDNATLDELATLMGQHQGSHALVTGYADARAGQMYNINLSRDRAQSVAAYLTGQGIDATRLRTMGLGPIGPVGKGIELADYRRVEVFVWD